MKQQTKERLLPWLAIFLHTKHRRKEPSSSDFAISTIPLHLSALLRRPAASALASYCRPAPPLSRPFAASRRPQQPLHLPQTLIQAPPIRTLMSTRAAMTQTETAAAQAQAPAAAAGAEAGLASTTEIPSLDSFPETGTPKHAKLGGYDFYRSLGSPQRVVAPMVEGSELAWRILSRRHGAELVYSPMINSKIFGVGGDGKTTYRETHFNMTCNEEGAEKLDLGEHAKEGDTDRPLFVQFCGHDPELLLQSALAIQDRCDAVDLNLGCPQTIAKRGHYGAFLMEDWPLIFRLINILHLNLKIPVTAKMRVFPDVERTVAYARMLERAGAQIITCHGRTREMKGHFTGLADWRKIAAVKRAVRVPVFANGNILYPKCVDDALRLTGADGVMSAEGNLYNPAIFARGTEPIHAQPLAGPSTLPLVNPTPQFPLATDLCHEYLDIVAGCKTPPSPAAAKSHLFKMTKPALAVHADFRPKLGQARMHGQESGEARVREYRAVVRELEQRLRADMHDARYLAPPEALRKGTSLSARLPDDVIQQGQGKGGKISAEQQQELESGGARHAVFNDFDDPHRPAYIPHWLVQPYFRPPLPEEELAKRAQTKEEQELRNKERKRAARKRRAARIAAAAAATAEGDAEEAGAQAGSADDGSEGEEEEDGRPIEINDKQAADEEAMGQQQQQASANGKRKVVAEADLEDDEDELANGGGGGGAAPEKKLKDRIEDAQRLKSAANEHFAQGRYDGAAALYDDAIAELPPRPAPEKPEQEEGADEDDGEASEEVQDKGKAKAEEDGEEIPIIGSDSAITALSAERLSEQAAADAAVAKLRAALYCNLAACRLKLEQWDAAVAACSEALNDDPTYVKALHRRATAYEHVGGWSGISNAMSDLRAILALPRSNGASTSASTSTAHVPPALRRTTEAKLRALEPEAKRLGEKEKDEMIGKLKGLGDSILGHFGLSTKNFQFTQQDGGGYSMNFVR